MEALAKLILGIGAVELTKDSPLFTSLFREFTLETKVGLLTIDLRTEQNSCYTLFSRFKEPQRAAIHFPCNPHSGKYNAFISNDVTPEQAANIAVEMLKTTLPK